MSNNQETITKRYVFESLCLGICNLFVICILIIVILIKNLFLGY